MTTKKEPSCFEALINIVGVALIMIWFMFVTFHVWPEIEIWLLDLVYR